MTHGILVLAAIAILAAAEPALANKFETISGGVSGSWGAKRDWLQKFLFVAGGASLFGAILALVVPHSNPLYLNYGTWKQSAIVLFILAAGLLIAGLII